MKMVNEGLWGDKLGDEDGCHGTEEDGVSTEESKELCGRGEDFPLQ